MYKDRPAGQPNRQQNSTEQERSTDTQREPNRKRLNPRLVFADPDSFFSDLLMEQQEQS